ncbi:MAG: response regulator [Candidatus Brennerbacteria bacterium]|nr:response regulator [Candidatus Brennerbacteria bacterium]
MYKILIADDDHLIVSMYKKGFENAGFLAVTANNGEAAIETAKKEKPDIILMDLRMPIKDGIDATIALKSEITTKNIPVIFLTSIEDGQGHNMAAKAIGAEDFLTKSETTIQEIIAKVNETLARPAHGGDRQ